MDKERLKDIISKFKGKRVGVVGDVLLDSYLFGKVDRVNHERPGYPLLRVEKEEHRLGGAGNVAANLISLGAKVVLFGAVGNDIYGSALKKRCKKRRIKFVPVFEGKTLLKQRRIEISHNDYLGREDFGEARLEKLSKKNESKLISAIKREKPDVLVLTDYNKKIFTGGLAKRIIQFARSEGIATVVDPKPQNIESFRGATLISPNIRESREILGKDHENTEVKEVVRALKKTVESKYVVATCGPDGMASYDGSFHHIPTEVKELTDVTGAGDTVTATLALALICGANLEEASFIANSAAGIVVEKLGTASVTQGQLLQKIEKMQQYL